jgi:hypothetical protein
MRTFLNPADNKEKYDRKKNDPVRIAKMHFGVIECNACLISAAHFAFEDYSHRQRRVKIPEVSLSSLRQLRLGGFPLQPDSDIVLTFKIMNDSL